MVEQKWESDPAGRIKNISLAPNSKNALFPLFEAIMNSIHAIENRFGKVNLTEGKIELEAVKNEEWQCCGSV